MHFSALVVLLLSSLSVAAALPVLGTSSNHENGRSVDSSYGWSFFQKISIWTVSHEAPRGPHDREFPLPNIETINIPPVAIDNPCLNKGPLRCPPFTSYSVTSIPHRNNNCAQSPNRSPATQGMFDSLWSVERVLAPVGILMAMIWLGFLAVGLVAAVDYVWVRWGRGYSGYPGVEIGDGEEKAGTGRLDTDSSQT